MAQKMTETRKTTRGESKTGHSKTGRSQADALTTAGAKARRTDTDRNVPDGAFDTADRGDARSAARRLPKEARRRQLLEMARTIVREEGADRLTLGHLALRAGVSKPVVYDHFETPSVLLIELYRWLDTEKVDAFRRAMADDPRNAEETCTMLAAAYIDCASDQTGEFSAVGAALGGSTEKAAVFQELLEHSVQMFVAVLAPHGGASKADLERCCVGLVGAGEALAAALVRGRSSRKATIRTFAALIRGCMT